MVLGIESLVNDVKYLAGGLLLGSALLFGGCADDDDVEKENLSDFRAEPGERQVTLSWKTAPTCGAEIMRKVDTFPADLQDGTLVYDGLGQAYIDTAVSPGTLYCYSAFPYSIEDPIIYTPKAASATPYDYNSPGMVNYISATSTAAGIELSWTNPTAPDFDGVIIRRGTVSYPTSHTNDAFVYQGSGQSYTDSGLPENVPYFYSIFSFDDIPNYSSRATISLRHDSVYAVGWIGNGSNGWKQTSTPSIGSDFQSFDQPGSIFVDSSGNIFVKDSSNNRICKWDSAGNALGWIGGGSNGWKQTSGTSSGTDLQSFDTPSDVFVDTAGNIYVTDWHNDRVCKWDSNANAIGWFGGGSNGWKTTSAPPFSNASDYQSFDYPSSLFVDSSGNFYIADHLNNRVCKWDTNATAIGWIGGGSNGWKQSSGDRNGGSSLRHFNHPKGIFVDTNGDIYIADTDNHRILKWDSSGNAVGWLGDAQHGWNTYSGATADFTFQSFDEPYDVFLSSDDHLYIADCRNHRISKWEKASGIARGWFGGGSDGWKTIQGAFNTDTSDYQTFYCPSGVFVDTTGNIYTGCWAKMCVSKWKD
ncbi:MAG: NHL repeat-containing protein [Nanoarchaeota archaeon]|nr:NHL repeat-containing protein [Nanoarchaeota archaeon]